MTIVYVQQYDLTWACYDDDVFDADIVDGQIIPICPIGRAKTKELSLIDLLEQMEEAGEV